MFGRVRAFASGVAASIMLGSAILAAAPAATAAPLVQSGNAYDVIGHNTRCTIAFTGYGWGGEPRAMTAGHCVRPGAEVRVHNGPVGRVIHSVDNFDMGLDYAVIEFDRGVVMGNSAVPLYNSGSSDFAMPIRGIFTPNSTLDGAGTLMFKDGATTARQLQILAYSEGNRVIYTGPRYFGDSGSGVRTLDGRIVAIHNHEHLGGIIVSYGTKAQSAIDDFNRFGQGGFAPVFA